MTKILALFALVGCLFMISAQDCSAQQKVQKSTKKAVKKAAKVMCGCTSLKELNTIMKKFEGDPSAATEGDIAKVEAELKKAQVCIEELTKLSDGIPASDKTYFGDETEKIMAKKCPDILKILNESDK